jgi:hypothetical protein
VPFKRPEKIVVQKNDQLKSPLQSSKSLPKDSSSKTVTEKSKEASKKPSQASKSAPKN